MTQAGPRGVLDEQTEEQMLLQIAIVMMVLKELGIPSGGGPDWSPAGRGGDEDAQVVGLTGYVKEIMKMRDQGYDSRRMLMQQTTVTAEEKKAQRMNQGVTYMQQNSLLVLRALEMFDPSLSLKPQDQEDSTEDAQALENSNLEPTKPKPDRPLMYRSLHMAFLPAVLGSEFAVRAVIDLTSELFQGPTKSSPKDIMSRFTSEDFVVQGDVVPIGVTGDSPSQQFTMDLFRNWVSVLYFTMIEMSFIPAPDEEETANAGELLFVRQTLSLVEKELVAANSKESSQTEKELEKDYVGTEEGWVQDPFLAKGSTAMAVMRQQGLLIRLVRDRCLKASKMIP
mmetsp:Transcript_24647/g.46747  ORF Transcript_24647/g.46747 Transcript_24647/m.46747 type:complete len:339 (-) Transcript_24647:253-1269(-)